MFLTPEDLTPFATIDAAAGQALIDDAEATVLHVAPCLADDTNRAKLSDGQNAWLKALVRGVVLRWHQAGSGALASTTHTAGPLSIQETFDSRYGSGRSLWKQEIIDLQKLCRDLAADDAPERRAFTIDPFGLDAGPYDPITAFLRGDDE